MGMFKRLFHRGDQGVGPMGSKASGTASPNENPASPDERTPTRPGDSPADNQLLPTASAGEQMNDDRPELHLAPFTAPSSPDEPTLETAGVGGADAQVTAYSSLPEEPADERANQPHPPIEPTAENDLNARAPEPADSPAVPGSADETNAEAPPVDTEPAAAPTDPESPADAEKPVPEESGDTSETAPVVPAEPGTDPFSTPIADPESTNTNSPSDTQPLTEDSATTTELPDHAEPEEAAVPIPGTKLGGRYVVIKAIDADEATHLLGGTVHVVDADLYAVDDTRAFERCWSCGSAGNVAGQRFCIDCGALLQNRQLVLARTTAAKGESEEFSENGAYFHLVRPRKQFGNAGLALEVGAWSAEGPHHPNEDSYWSAAVGGCFDSKSNMFGVMVLADGMGGYAPGSGLISKMIVNSVGRSVFHLLHTESETEKEEVEIQTVIRSAVAEANSKVLKEIEVHGEMGATLVVTVVYGQSAFIANIGDSRAYYIAPSGAVTQITRDQSLIEQQVAAGLLTADAAFTAFGNNVILHAIGEEAVEEAFDWYVQPLEPGGRLLLCTDGYWKTVRRDIWDGETAQGAPTLRDLARSMVENALAKGSDDNTTVLIVGID
jgi:serine/threonine protein phosphatase PrpC